MDAGTIGVLIPIFGIMAGMLAIWTKHQQKIAELNVKTTAENTAEKAAQYASHVGELENRVRVLERIVTDRGYDIATQIDALRDQRAVEERQAEDRGAGFPLAMNRREKV